MKSRYSVWSIAAAAGLIAGGLLASPALGHSTPGAEAEPEAAPVSAEAGQEAESAWSPRRTAAGHPDMQGYWDGGPANASHSIEDGCCDPVHARMQSRGPERLGLPFQLIVDPPDGRIPYQEWAEERRTELLYDMETPTELAHIDPEDRCLLLGAPRSNYRGDLEIRQNDGHVVIQYEWAHAYRIIPTDGRPHVGGAIRMYNGDSRGRWEGDTLVVEVTNFNDEPWLDSHGSFYSENLRVVERYTLVDDDTLRYEATLEDPTVFTRPWTLRFDMGRIGRDGEYEFFEEACSEGVTNEHRLAAGRQAVARGERYIHTHEGP